MDFKMETLGHVHVWSSKIGTDNGVLNHLALISNYRVHNM